MLRYIITRRIIMKNKIAIILTLQFIITVFAFSGCGESTASSNSSKLTYCAYYEDAICDIIEKYNKYCTKHYDESYQIESISEITEVNLPAICLLNKAKANGYHYALLVDINEKYVSFYEGNFTNMCSVPINEFLCNVSNIFCFRKYVKVYRNDCERRNFNEKNKSK